MFKPLKSLFKYIQSLHMKPTNDDKLIHSIKAATETTTTTTTNTLSVTSIVASSSSSPAILQSEEYFSMNRMNVNSPAQNKDEDEQQSTQQANHTDDATQLLTNAPYTDYDEDDIETQIKSSIMLKKPLNSNVIRKASMATPSLASSSSSLSSFGIGINIDSRDNYNSYEIVSPHYNGNDIEDDELEDFRYDPTEEHFENSTKHNNTTITVIKSQIILNDVKRMIDIEEEENQNLKDKQFTNLQDAERNDIDAVVEDEENGEEPFINLKNLTSNGIIVDTEPSLTACLSNDNNHKDVILSNDDINIIMNNDNDNDVDPLEIVQEDHEAFGVDRTSVLKQLNLLNPLGFNQDDEDDAITVTDGEMECWLDNDEINNDNDKRPSHIVHDNTDEVHDDEANKPSSSSSTASCVDERGDGSDSGLGSETSALQITVESMHEASQLISSLNTSLTTTTTPMTTTTIEEKECNANIETTNQSHTVCSDDGREKEEEEERLPPSSPSSLSTSALTIAIPAKEITTTKVSNLKRRLKIDADYTNTNLGSTNVTIVNAEIKAQKKPKRSISFNSVHIYYFARQQGFNCVPSAGGCTLGMAAIHESSKTMTLAEHTAELRRAHRLQLQEINPRGSSSDDSEESEEDFLSEGSGSDLDGESNGFLQPVSPKQRRAILKAAGVRKIDPAEKAECRNIRNSREICGCSCRNYCDPETCSCSQSGIKCQVDRDMFPCGCTRESCGNPIGRVEFNSDRVHSHYIHTLLRLEVENQQENPYHMHHTPNVLDSTSLASPSTVTLASVVDATSLTMPSCNFYQNHVPTQSNYSSGYGSPAYNIGSESMTQSALANLNSDYYHHHSVQQQASTSSAHIYEPHLNANHTPIINQFDVDDLDADLYSTTTATAVASTCSYAAAAARVNAAAAGAIVAPYHNIDYDQIPTRQQVSSATFNAYHNTNTMTNNSYLNTADDISMMVVGTSSQHHTYSSCAVPSDPPFGTATTTESSIIEFATTNQLVTVLETTTAPSCHVALTAADISNAMETEETNNFLNALQSVNESTVRHNKISNINSNIDHKTNNKNNGNQINDLLHVTAATTATATINGHLAMATVASASSNTEEMQQQEQMHMDVEIGTAMSTSTTVVTITTTTATSTTVVSTMNDLRHCDIKSQKIINTATHNNLLDHAETVAAAAAVVTLESDILNVTTSTTAAAATIVTSATTSLTTIMNDTTINS